MRVGRRAFRQGESVEPYRRRIHAPQGHKVRASIEQWARTTEISFLELPPQIQDRSADVWEPLIATADAIGGEWPERARVAAVTLVTDLREAEPSLGIKLLTDLKFIFQDFDKMATKAILAALGSLGESPWNDLRGRPLDERGLAKRLAAYSIRSTTIRIGESVAKGYRREDLVDAWTRYVPSPSGNSVTSATPVTEANGTKPTMGDIDPDGWSFNLKEAS